MSPLPSPTPLRRTVLRMLFSPGSLLFGFVVLIITMCPGARGEESFGLLALNAGLSSPAAVDITTLDVPVAPARSAPVIGRSTRFDRVPSSTARSATPAERSSAAPAVRDTESFRHSRSALPLLTDPLLNDSASARISPMTGPAVGVRPKLPISKR
jgi:hypothetical protein